MKKNTKNLVKSSLLVLFGVIIIVIVFFNLFNSTGETVPVREGSITEASVGAPRFLNPALATRQIEHDLNSLIYSGLTKRTGPSTYTPDIAKSYVVNDDGTEYTFTLRDNIFFHDNRRLTSDDVLFTIQTIQDPQFQSPYALIWKDITVIAPTPDTVVFTLPKPYAGFITQTTLGILPQHIWEQADAQGFVYSPFNTEPIGSGPYKVKSVAIDENETPTSITLEAFENYAHGKPFITDYTVRFFAQHQEVINALQKGSIDLFFTSDPVIQKIESNSQAISKHTQPTLYSLFIQKKNSPLLTEPKTLSALKTLIKTKGNFDNYGVATSDYIPTTFTTTNTTQEETKNLAELLTDAGWTVNEETGLFISNKDESETFSLTTVNNETFIEVAEHIKTLFAEIDIPLEIEVVDPQTLREDIIPNKKFDILLFGQQYVHPSDAFAYWHSSQREFPGLNITKYINTNIDKLTNQLRNTFYEPTEEQEIINKINTTLLETDDTPIIPLYTSHGFIAKNTHKKTSITIPQVLIEPKDRYTHIHEWHQNETQAWPIFIKN